MARQGSMATYLVMLFTLAFTLLWFSVNLTSGEEAVAEEDYADDGVAEPMLRKPPPPSPSPSTTPVVGPLPMRAVLGDCFQFVGSDGNGDDNRYEVCGYKSVRQTVVKTGNSFSCGYWNKWNTEVVAGKTMFVSMLYDDGESCDDKVKRQTTVYFRCNAAAKEPIMVSASEPSMCHYELDVETHLWCDVEKLGLSATPKRDLLLLNKKK